VRLFVALEIPADVRDNLAAFLGNMRELSQRLEGKPVRWVRTENLHVTLKFIGEVADTKLEGIRGALSTVQVEAPLEIRVAGLGFFPNKKRPDVLWTGINSSASLPALASDIDRVLATQGIPRENRAFVPHLTLARFARPALHENLLSAIEQTAACSFGSFRPREFHLIESHLKPRGSEYTFLASFPSNRRPDARWPS